MKAYSHTLVVLPLMMKGGGEEYLSFVSLKEHFPISLECWDLHCIQLFKICTDSFLGTKTVEAIRRV